VALDRNRPIPGKDGRHGHDQFEQHDIAFPAGTRYYPQHQRGKNQDGANKAPQKSQQHAGTIYDANRI